jgi:FKBP-type peptidyl-prolyl cis-trans isomerase
MRTTIALVLFTVCLSACGDRQMVTLDSGLRYVDMVVGAGAEAANGMEVECHYTLWFSDNDGMVKRELVQNSEDYGDPLQCRIGYGLIPGWSEGMVGMKEGGVRRLYVPWELGYGENGSPAVGIPGKANLIFEIKFLRAL